MSLLVKIQLIPLSDQYLELLRNWRNSQEVNRFFRFREHITSQQQKEFFRNLLWHKEKYYILFYEGEPIGCAYIKNIDEKRQKAEPGFFIGELKWHNTPLASASLIKFLDFVFFENEITRLEGYVHCDNLSAIHLYKKLGFDIYSSVYQDSYLSSCTYSSYVVARHKITI